MQSKSTQWLIGIVILLLIGFGGYKLYTHYQNNTLHMGIPTASPTGTVPTQSTSTSATPKNDTSDKALDQDMQDVQNSFNQLQQDQNTVSNDTTSQAQDIPQQ